MLSSQLSKQAKAREAVLIMVAILGIIYIAFDYLYMPKKQALVDVNSEIETIQKQKDAISKLNKALELKFKKMQTEMQHKAQVDATTDPRILMLKQYKKSIYKNVSDFLYTIMGKTHQSAVTIEAMKHSVPTEHNGYTSATFTIELYGNFMSVLDFIKNLEAVPALITVDKLDIQVNKNDVSIINTTIAGTFFELEKDNVF